ncbi:hypothetical protein MELA_00650 [Candidatus Methylomirabilis lanthanidiphila]|uniref:Uncharacterized protein n=1 Tax=Candidatus Methylomirabilis lanthanidiphila TaxID=2211376 RepID=A0A564ZG34_9BACT|nr:hypothetical protein [Candidatus Methylomirabilis lanthanidiphila]VUZ84279.1 hypothetical protein MELA_00650 [Candidatus Methylomirabilis lanthanidiphila]
MKEDETFSKTQPLRLGFLFVGREESGGPTDGASRQPRVLSVAPEDLPVIIRLLLREGPRDYVLRKTKAGKLLLNRRDETVG